MARVTDIFAISDEELSKSYEALSEVVKERIDKYTEKVKEEFGVVAEHLFRALVNAWLVFLNYMVEPFGYLVGAIEAHKEIGKQDAFADYPFRAPDLDAAIRAWQRAEISTTELKTYALRHGFSDDVLNVFIAAARQMATASEVVDAYVKREIDAIEARSRLRKLGYNDDDVELLLKTAYRLPSTSEILTAWFRELITDDEAADMLARQGYRPEDIPLLMETAWALPSLSDLIRMMVRDVFNEAVVARYGYDEEYPAEVEEWVKKQGMDPKWAKYYWRAHWELPSPTMAYEMFRRKLITLEDIDTLLKIADYPRFWREKMVQLAYELPTRVDVRRMYDLGVIDERRVYEFYTQLGYREDVAEALTEFTIADTISEERTKLRNQLLECFEYGMITEQELRQSLKALRYNDNAIDVIVEAKKLELEREYLKAQVEIVRERYMQGIIDENKAISELSQLGISTEAVSRIVRKWEAEKLKKHRRITLYQLQQLYKKRIIDDSRALAELKEAGYTEDDAVLLLELIKKGGDLEA